MTCCAPEALLLRRDHGAQCRGAVVAVVRHDRRAVLRRRGLTSPPWPRCSAVACGRRAAPLLPYCATADVAVLRS